MLEGKKPLNPEGTAQTAAERQAELDAAKAAFFAKGGKVDVLAPEESACPDGLIGKKDMFCPARQKKAAMASAVSRRQRTVTA